MKRAVLALLALCGLALGACNSRDEAVGAGHSKPQKLMNHEEAVQAELAAQRAGPMHYQRFLLMQNGWECLEECPKDATIRFSVSSTTDADLLVKGSIGGKSYTGSVWLWPGYHFVLNAGNGVVPCRFVTNWHVTCKFNEDLRNVVFTRPRL